jgi:hypothetical protein
VWLTGFVAAAKSFLLFAHFWIKPYSQITLTESCRYIRAWGTKQCPAKWTVMRKIPKTDRGDGDDVSGDESRAREVVCAPPGAAHRIINKMTGERV